MRPLLARLTQEQSLKPGEPGGLEQPIRSSPRSRRN